MREIVAKSCAAIRGAGRLSRTASAKGEGRGLPGCAGATEST
jgi:hypothetical protein